MTLKINIENLHIFKFSFISNVIPNILHIYYIRFIHTTHTRAHIILQKANKNLKITVQFL